MTTLGNFLYRLALVKLQKPEIYDELLTRPIGEVVQLMDIIDSVLTDPELKEILKRVKIKTA